MKNLLTLLFSFILTYSYAQDSLIISNIVINGNKKTKERVILREVTLKKDSLYSKKQFEKEIIQIQRNIFNTQLFTFVEVKDSLNSLYINVTERWYIWPIPILEFADQNINNWWKTKDFSRLNYGAYLVWRNFSGANDDFFISYQTGFTQKYEASYKYPNFDKKQQFGIFAKTYYSHSKKQSFATINNKQYFPDINSNNYISEQWFAQTALEYRKKIFATHNFSISYSNYSSSDSISLSNPNYLGSNRVNLNYIQNRYRFIYDKRDNRSYPLKGYYFKTNISNYQLFGAANLTHLDVEFRKHYKVIGKLNGASSIKLKTSNNTQQPYILQHALGYSNSEVGHNNFVRSYEANVIEGQHYGLAKSDLKFLLFENKQTEVKKISQEQFGKLYYAYYLTAFIDGAYVKNVNKFTPNSLTNEFLLGYGLGINLATYYDLVYRFEYSFNRHGGSGFNLHFVIPI